MHFREDPLHPERALLTPTWLGSLALLVANDHWLKGSGLLPGVLTGKLSDFAGMLVAPALLATLLRVHSKRGLLACHVAVGAVFAGIQISTGFADLWSAAMGLLGHPWVITSDLTDLLALPFLWLSWRLLLPAMDHERPALVGLQRSAVAGASVFGLWATVATSDDDGRYSDELCGGCETDETGGWETDGGWENVDGQVYIHNPNDFAININIRTLRPDVVLDCGAIASDPGRLLPDEAFGPAEHWELPPTTNVGVAMPLSCGAAKVAGEGIPEQIIFSTELGWVTTFPGSHESLDELSSAGAAIVFDGVAQWSGGEQWRHTPKLDSAPAPETCLPDPGERHLDWSEISSQAVVEVLAMSAGLDGCHELELLPWSGANMGESFSWYLCAPESAIRLEIGEYWDIDSQPNKVTARLVDPATHQTQVDDLGRALRTLRFERGMNSAGSLIATVALDDPSCPWNLADGCLEVARKLDLVFGGVVALPGVPTVTVDDSDMRHELIVGRARALALTAGECGSSSLPHDIDYALVSEPNL
ncbi:MAG TPA: hypothetical protein VM869_32710 [Enhygromyxa sp.]|nr:hypothetical protein [Enhygromyxa sp.]